MVQDEQSKESNSSQTRFLFILSLSFSPTVTATVNLTLTLRQWDDDQGTCRMPIPTKGRGRQLMSSDFVSEEGLLQYSDEDWSVLKVKSHTCHMTIFFSRQKTEWDQVGFLRLVK